MAALSSLANNVSSSSKVAMFSIMGFWAHLFSGVIVLLVTVRSERCAQDVVMTHMSEIPVRLSHSHCCLVVTFRSNAAAILELSRLLSKVRNVLVIVVCSVGI